MQTMKMAPRVAIFLAGVAAGALTGSRRRAVGAVDPRVGELKQSIKELESRLASQEAANANRIERIDARLDEHAAKLAEVPTTAQIVGAMEQLLAKTMASLDERLGTQANSIEVLRATVSQTDSLLERVLESLDSLQPPAETAGSNRDAFGGRPSF